MRNVKYGWRSRRDQERHGGGDRDRGRRGHGGRAAARELLAVIRHGERHVRRRLALDDVAAAQLLARRAHDDASVQPTVGHQPDDQFLAREVARVRVIGHLWRTENKQTNVFSHLSTWSPSAAD